VRDEVRRSQKPTISNLELGNIPIFEK
jgi:hypothetical protein